ncbi:hypothetical protein JOB18_007475 [Solea senegalensis]|uniref:Uncharacterized protein n=1 Tax=Solea senegalensis TaxID=28829 RepID=A0AAV6QSM9_SOLSE|nr:hypothetical protein JOB18_007475 [Solea senegalensis]
MLTSQLVVAQTVLLYKQDLSTQTVQNTSREGANSCCDSVKEHNVSVLHHQRHLKATKYSTEAKAQEQAGSVSVVSSTGPRDILQQSSDCDAVVSLSCPDKLCTNDDCQGVRAQDFHLPMFAKIIGSNHGPVLAQLVAQTNAVGVMNGLPLAKSLPNC